MMSEFSNQSAFKQASEIAKNLKEVEVNQSLEEIMDRTDRISAAMELDLNSIYDSLNVVIDMVDDPNARRTLEDIRDEVYRCMR
jgi:hypothetical protein